MTRALLVLFACSAAACVNVQDLGGDQRAPEPATTAPARAVPITLPTSEPAPAPEPMSCPTSIPTESAACSNVAWCAYPLEGGSGLAVHCGCSLGHWLCLRVRDDRRTNPVAVDELPLTIASCTEGASCEAGTKCKVGVERACYCTSNSRLRCVRPTH